MNWLFAVLSALLSMTALAQEQVPIFSSYSPKLKFVSYDKRLSVTRFEGDLALEGVLYFEFDRADEGHMDGVNFAKFVPVASMVHLLPAVVAGDYPAPVKYLELPADEALRAAMGKREAARLIHGTRAVVSTQATLVIHDYLSDVECDSRSYFVKHYSIVRKPQREVLGAASYGGEPPHGC